LKRTLTERLEQKVSEAVVSHLRIAPCQISLARGALSITFDDFPKSSWTVAGAVLAEYGVKATYFVSGGCNGEIFSGVLQYTLDDLDAVHSAGHEIGCHTYDHLAASRCSAVRYAASIERNCQFLAKHGLTMSPTSFAYTYGQAPLPHRRLLATQFAGCRSAVPGLNGPVLDRSLLRAVGLKVWRKRRGDLLAGIQKLIERAAQDRLWLIIFTHDVSEHPSPFGCTPAELRKVLDSASRAAIDILPINRVLNSLSQMKTEAMYSKSRRRLSANSPQTD